MEWLFEPGVRTRRGGSAAAYAFKPTLDVFVREVLQNAKDQKRRDSPSVRVHFGLRVLRGRALQDFLDTLHWNELRDHVEVASRSQHAQFLGRAIKDLESRNELLLLRIDDAGTGGLVGGDLARDRPFASLAIDELFSTKESAGTGGSYGLGKSVLWRFSALSTVLFSSRLEDDAYSLGEKGLRLFGRAQLPWHSIDDEDFDGPCWFGKPGKHDGRDIAWSVWDPQSAAIATKLQVDREATPGTSILIVAFAPPAEEAVHPGDLCHQFCSAASRHFWPVIAGDSPALAVTADLLDVEAGETLASARATITDEVKPFVACLDAYRTGRVKEEIEEDSDVAAAEIPLKIPATLSGNPVADAAVTLCVRLAPKAKTLVNQVAYTRGFGMIVKYRNLTGFALAAQPFVATLICGGLRGDTDADKALEKFLRLAEPPEHDTWASNQRLQTTYKKGYAALIDKLEREVAAVIKAKVTQAAAEGEKGPRLLSSMFPIGRTGPGKRKHPFTVTARKAVLGPDGVWLFSAEVRRNAGEGPWHAKVALRFSTEDGAEGSVVERLDKVTPKAAHRVVGGVATIHVPETANKMSFTGRSDPALHPVDSRRATVRLDVVAGGAQAADEDATAEERVS